MEEEFRQLNVRISSDLFDRFDRARGKVTQADAITQILEYVLPLIEGAQSAKLSIGKGDGKANKIKVT